MNIQEKEETKIMGIAIRTSNEDQQAAIDIPRLWERFFSENIAEKIPSKIDSAIYSVYTDYERDYTRPYTCILGCRVSNLDNIPEGMTGKVIEGGKFAAFTAKGNLNEGAVFNKWTEIWNADLPRAYTADLEVYGERALNPEVAEVDIFIALEEQD